MQVTTLSVDLVVCLKEGLHSLHHDFRLQEVRIHYVAAGTEGKPLMLLVHGFPEFWYSWRYQLREFSKEYRYCTCCIFRFPDLLSSLYLYGLEPNFFQMKSNGNNP